jgi:hypothetical protein
MTEFNRSEWIKKYQEKSKTQKYIKKKFILVYPEIMDYFNNLSSCYKFKEYLKNNDNFNININLVFVHGNYTNIVNFFEYCIYNNIIDIVSDDIQLKILKFFIYNKDFNVHYYVLTTLLLPKTIKYIRINLDDININGQSFLNLILENIYCGVYGDKYISKEQINKMFTFLDTINFNYNNYLSYAIMTEKPHIIQCIIDRNAQFTFEEFHNIKLLMLKLIDPNYSDYNNYKKCIKSFINVFNVIKNLLSKDQIKELQIIYIKEKLIYKCDFPKYHKKIRELLELHEFDKLEKND